MRAASHPACSKFCAYFTILQYFGLPISGFASPTACISWLKLVKINMLQIKVEQQSMALIARGFTQKLNRVAPAKT